VDTDQESLCALAKRIGGHDDQSNLEGFEVSAVFQEKRAEPVQDVKADLAESLLLEDRPIVIPANQQVVPVEPEGLGDVSSLQAWPARIEQQCALPGEIVNVD
jgi:hypothetical protein